MPQWAREVELACYITSAGERIPFGQRVDGVVRVTDKSVGPGRSFVSRLRLARQAALDHDAMRRDASGASYRDGRKGAAAEAMTPRLLHGSSGGGYLSRHRGRRAWTTRPTAQRRLGPSILRPGGNWS